MMEMAIDLKKHPLTAYKYQYTYLMLGPSIEDNQ